MNAIANAPATVTIPEGIRVTLETFERLIQTDDKRRRELLAEISTLVLRQRVIGATQDASWITESFIKPRLAELKTVVGRLMTIRRRLQELREQWTQPSRPPMHAVESPDSSGIVCLTA